MGRATQPCMWIVLKRTNSCAIACLMLLADWLIKRVSNMDLSVSKDECKWPDTSLNRPQLN